jgi:acyl carrier protein
VRPAVENDIRLFLTENFPLTSTEFSLQNDESLIEAGVIDSTGILELIEFIESRYEISIPDEDVLPENLDSVDSITCYVVARIEHGSRNGHG